MKKLIALLIALMMIFAFCACNGAKGGNETQTPTAGDPMAAKTMADIFADAEEEFCMSSYDENMLVYIIKNGGNYYRAECKFTEELSNQYGEIDILDDDYDEKVEKLLSPVAVDKVINISETLPSDKEINAFVGKTGQELLDSGFNADDGYSITEEATVYYMSYGNFKYDVTFDGTLADDANFDEDFKPLTVKSIEYSGVADVVSDIDWTP